VAERAALIGVAAAFLLLAYAKMEGRAEVAVAQSNLAALLPLIHAYAVEHGGYEGLTVEKLEAVYGARLERGAYEIVDRGDTDYCLQTVQGGKAWHVSASRSEPSPGPCAG
jgi:hypothetical protein